MVIGAVVVLHRRRPAFLPRAPEGLRAQRAAGRTAEWCGRRPNQPVWRRSHDTSHDPIGGRRRAGDLDTDAIRGPGRPRDEAASQAIFDAALHQLEQLGYGRMTVESVAAEAGVSRASVYRRFRDKADLVTAAIAQANATRDGQPAEGEPPLIHALRSSRSWRSSTRRFAESCLEVIGSLVGAREDPTALAMHRERVVAPRRAYARSLLEAAQARGELAVRCRPRRRPPDAGRLGPVPPGER